MSGYRETLDVLGRLQGRERERGARPQRQEEPDAARGPTGSGPGQTQPERGPEEPSPRGPAAPPLRGPGSPLGMRGSGNPGGVRGSRRGASAGLAGLALVLVAGAAVAYGVARTHHTHAPTPAASQKTRDTTSTTTTSTTLPSSYTAVSAGPSAATYAPAATSYSLEMGATSGNCWMSVTSQNGTTVFAKTLTAGSTASVSLSGRATVLVGAPTVATLSAGGVPLQLPSSIVGPFTVTLAPK